MSDYRGVIIEESLENKDALSNIKIVSTKIEKVIEKHQTPWLSRWTMHAFEVKEDNARHLADLLSKSLSQENGGEWYADFKNETSHCIVFRGKIFFVNRRQKEECEKAKNYGISIGIPDYQCDFDIFWLGK